ncbi:MAG: hypothetical protein IPM37_20545 [Hahellaceae bacterium]|nr:hypothetical protein [Hahellaceae bacterium]
MFKLRGCSFGWLVGCGGGGGGSTTPVPVDETLSHVETPVTLNPNLVINTDIPKSEQTQAQTYLSATVLRNNIRINGQTTLDVAGLRVTGTSGVVYENTDVLDGYDIMTTVRNLPNGDYTIGFFGTFKGSDVSESLSVTVAHGGTIEGGIAIIDTLSFPADLTTEANAPTVTIGGASVVDGELNNFNLRPVGESYAYSVNGMYLANGDFIMTAPSGVPRACGHLRVRH